MFAELAGQFGLFVAGAVCSVLVLGLAVRVLWKQVSDQFHERLADKNTELSQVWGELRSERGEKLVERDERRRAQAATEAIERLLNREQELAAAAMQQAESWKQLYTEEKHRNTGRLPHGRGGG